MTQQAFLSQPIRDVRVRYVKQAACGAFAIVTVDFEPVDGGGVSLAIPNDVRLEFTMDDEDHRSVFEYLDGLADGITEELATHPDLHQHVKVVLRRAVFHAVDSNAMAFRQAGRLAVRTALDHARRTAPSR